MLAESATASAVDDLSQLDENADDPAEEPVASPVLPFTDRESKAKAPDPLPRRRMTTIADAGAPPWLHVLMM